MANIIKINNLVKKIEKNLLELKNELNKLEYENKNKSKKTQILPIETYENLKNEYNKLYEEYIIKNDEVIDAFVKSKNMTYLKAFCKANLLSVDTSKASKKVIINEIKRCFIERKAIQR